MIQEKSVRLTIINSACKSTWDSSNLSYDPLEGPRPLAGNHLSKYPSAYQLLKPPCPVNERASDLSLDFQMLTRALALQDFAVKLAVRMIKPNQETWDGR